MRWQGVTRQPVIHDDAAPCGKIGDKVESGTKSWMGEIHHDAKPCENSWGGEVEATALQLGGKALALEIYWNVAQIRGLWQSIRGQELALPLLGSGMIDLKYVETEVRVTVGKSVKARAEYDVLPDVSAGSLGKLVFSISVAGDKPGSHSEREPIANGSGSLFKHRAVGLAQDGHGDWIVEYQRTRVVELVRSSTDGDPKSGSRWLGCFQHAPHY